MTRARLVLLGLLAVGTSSVAVARGHDAAGVSGIVLVVAVLVGSVLSRFDIGRSRSRPIGRWLVVALIIGSLYAGVVIKLVEALTSNPIPTTTVSSSVCFIVLSAAAFTALWLWDEDAHRFTLQPIRALLTRVSRGTGA